MVLNDVRANEADEPCDQEIDPHHETEHVLLWAGHIGAKKNRDEPQDHCSSQNAVHVLQEASRKMVDEHVFRLPNAPAKLRRANAASIPPPSSRAPAASAGG